MQKTRETISRLCQLAAILFLAGGFGMAKSWLGVILIFALLPFGWIVRRYQRKWFASMMLVTYVGIAVYGLLSGISAYLVVAGVSAALAWWELEDRIPIFTRILHAVHRGQVRKGSFDTVGTGHIHWTHRC